MPDVADFVAAVQSLKALSEIAKSFINIRDVQAIRAKVMEFQEAILETQAKALAAQAEQSALREEVRGLKEKIRELEAWDAEKEKYEFVSPSPYRDGTFVYLAKQSESPQAGPYLCANCFGNRHKSIYQKEIRMPGLSEVLVCHHCGSDIYLTGEREPQHTRSAPRRQH